MRPVVLILAALLVALPVRAGEEPSMPATASVGGRDLVLNGSALRSVWGFRVYEVGLFLGERNGDPVAIMDRDRTPKRVRMNMLRSVEKEKFVATVRENIDQNLSAEEKAGFATELADYIGHLEKGGDIEPGRVITIDFVPGQGTLLGLDGKHLGTIAGDDFYHLMLRLWIGQPLQASIKDGLLGRPD
jgi:hypothetical protein